MRTDNCYYVDKTRFIPLIEAAPYYLFCIRPRRFGKSLWLSILQHYYDINLKDEFDFLFGDTYIGQNPTPERNSYLVMFLNFAAVNPAPHEVERSFEQNGKAIIQDFLIRYQQFFNAAQQQEILTLPTFADQLRVLFLQASRQRLKTYLLF
jgi:hypothetical protein